MAPYAFPSGAISNDPAPRRMSGGACNRTAPPHAAKQEDGMSVGAGPTGISRGYVQKLIREQPLQLAQMLKFEATDTSRYGRGMKISARRSENESMLYNMGLIPGDIVIRVNGKNVDHYRKNPGAWRPLLQGGKVRLELVRNGTLQNVTLELGR